jgi:hypothetical protein
MGLLASLVESIVLIAIAAALVTFVDVGVARGVCGNESRMVWARVLIPGGSSLVHLHGDAARPLYNCLQTIHHSMSYEDLPPLVVNGMKGVPFAGTWPRCRTLLRAHPPVGFDAHYYAMWWTEPETADSLCPRE